LIAGLYHSRDKSEFGYKRIFRPIIDEINALQRDGIEFNLPDYSGKIYFELGAILSDNLGCNKIFGFVESFRSNYPCRICKIHQQAMQSELYEMANLLRTDDIYAKDLQLGNASLTGVKEECPWLEVHQFSMFEQLGVDVLHDLNEGVLKYVMCTLQ